MNSILSIKNITKAFNKGTTNEKIALNKLSFELEKGDFVTMLGSNGAGKSTLFNAILGTFYVDSGSIVLDGKNITYMKDYKRAMDIGCLFQNPLRGTAPNMTIEENLSLAYGRKASKSFFAMNKKDSDYFRQLLAELDLGLEDRMKTKIGLLSGGQRQAVSLLMSTISKPKLLLLDEHTAALDPQTAEKVLKITKKIVERDKISTMMITHNINSALAYGNRTIMMDDGKIILDIKGVERDNMTVEKLLECYSGASNKQLATDRMLFSK